MVAHDRRVIRLTTIHNFRLIDFMLGQQCLSLLMLMQKGGLEGMFKLRCMLFSHHETTTARLTIRF
jgi:hypothetical protein